MLPASCVNTVTIRDGCLETISSTEETHVAPPTSAFVMDFLFVSLAKTRTSFVNSCFVALASNGRSDSGVNFL